MSTLSQLPKNVAFLVNHYTLPTDTEEYVMDNIIAVRRHLESKRIYRHNGIYMLYSFANF